MNSFLKVQSASILGSVADYLLTIAGVEWLKWPYLLANLAGNITGIAVQFILCRSWAFRPGKHTIKIQLLRFLLVFAGNLILSAAGVYALTAFVHLNYILSKTIVSIILGLTFNYYMQKKFVFA